jgi:hypothetical protein
MFLASIILSYDFNYVQKHFTENLVFFLCSLKSKRHELFISFPCNMYILFSLLVSMGFFFSYPLSSTTHLKQGIQSNCNCRFSHITCMPMNCPHFVLTMSLWCLCRSIEPHCVTYSSFEQGIHSKQLQFILYNMPTKCV